MTLNLTISDCANHAELIAALKDATQQFERDLETQGKIIDSCGGGYISTNLFTDDKKGYNFDVCTFKDDHFNIIDILKIVGITEA